MEFASKSLQSRLLHVHVCLHCASAFHREEVEGRVHTTGVFICTKCGRDGPLNIQILEEDTDGLTIRETKKITLPEEGSSEKPDRRRQTSFRRF